MKESCLYKIRPAGRHLFTIGRDLIKDPQAAILELVKNAYDADSEKVDISFSLSSDSQKISIIIKDFGHGMSRNDILTKWLVPSTDNKQKQQISPKGRIMQGKKGVGRYAVSLIGDDLLLDTVDNNKNKSQIYINWNDFYKYEYLDEVDVLVEFSFTDEVPGTELISTGGIEHAQYWTKKDKKGNFENIDQLVKELKKMLSPNKNTKDVFCVTLYLENFEEIGNKKIDITPFPIFDVYDYRISGLFNSNGDGNFVYENCKEKNLPFENIQLKENVICGNVRFDIKVYDRDDLKYLIDRGLKENNELSLTVNETKNILNEACGIGVYRNGFRIRPLGDQGYDWLKLDTQRIQNPSLILSTNQVIGVIDIESEELSGLEEKSARDGLKENESYSNLIYLTEVVLNIIQRRRFDYRRSVEKEKKKSFSEMESLFDSSDTVKEIESVLEVENISRETTQKVINVISKKQKIQEKSYKDIHERIAMYEGQATLGKIINLVLHEARKPLNFFSNQIKNTEYWANELKHNYSEENLEHLLEILDDYKLHTKLLADLFRKIDPLSSKSRGQKTNVNIRNIILKTLNIFESQIDKLQIEIDCNCSKDINYFAWEQDLIVILTNLIENSIYWIEKKNPEKKYIKINVEEKDFGFELDIIDSGVEISDSEIDSCVIFEPGYTSKTDGMGLGLALAGEAASRNNLKLKAISHTGGAHFCLETKEIEND